VKRVTAKPEDSLGADSTGFTLRGKYGLLLASLTGYVALALLAEHLAATGRTTEAGPWFHYAAGAVFGALVLGPYAAPRRRIARVVTLAVASAAIYWLAVRFVTETPIPYDVIVTLGIAGSSAALLCGLAVIVVAPRPFCWKLVPMLLAAGALGGAAFKFRIPDDELLLAGHATWQVLVCLALHFACLTNADDRPAGP
jgi:hypothetical protein